MSQERTLKESELQAQIREKDALLESQRSQLLSSRHTFNMQARDFTGEQASTGSKAGGEVNAMQEIQDLKHEIARLTESLSGFANFSQSMSQ